jgi:probable HAF family extracellular repeat protein
MKRFLVCILAFVPAVLGTARAPDPLAPRFRVTDLGTLGGERSEAYALNERGEVAGWAEAADGARRAFFYRAGKMTQLELPPSALESRAYGINDTGDLAGTTVVRETLRTADTGVEIGQVRRDRAILWRSGKPTEIGSGEAWDVNNRGQVVGHPERGPGFLWQDGKRTGLVSPESGYFVHPRAITDHGLIAGGLQRHNYGTRAVLVQDQKVKELTPDYSGLSSPFAFAANSAGAAAGVGPGLDGIACFWKDASPTPTYLGTMNGAVEKAFLDQHAGRHFTAAYGINDRAQIVGAGNVNHEGDLHAFFWQAGRLTDLNTLIPAETGWILEQARAINNRGQICGAGTLNGKRRAFLLTPSGP